MSINQALADMREAEEKYRDDPDELHGILDNILLEHAPKKIANEYRRIVKAASWWSMG
jgi:hypothetical protein